MTTNKREKYLKLQNGSDIRGVSLTGVPGESLSLREEEAKEIAIGFIIWLSDKLGKRPEDMTLAIGRDPRTSGPRLLDGLMDGFGEYGCKVYDFGYASTPAMFMATVFEDFACDGTVMITASHLPYNRNGFKFFNTQRTRMRRSRRSASRPARGCRPTDWASWSSKQRKTTS